MDYGELPEKENCEISRWELGTLNYEALAGFCGTEEYLAGLAPDHPCLDSAFSAIVDHEEKISAKFLEQIQPLLEAGKLRLLGSTNPKTRTPTFALSQPEEQVLRNINHYSQDTQTSDPSSLVRALNEAGIRCTHGNHYAVSLVDEALASPQVEHRQITFSQLFKQFTQAMQFSVFAKTEPCSVDLRSKALQWEERYL